MNYSDHHEGHDTMHDLSSRDLLVSDDLLPRLIVLQPNDGQHVVQLVILFSNHRMPLSYTHCRSMYAALHAHTGGQYCAYML